MVKLTENQAPWASEDSVADKYLYTIHHLIKVVINFKSINIIFALHWKWFYKYVQELLYGNYDYY